MKSLKLGEIEIFWLNGGEFELDGGTMFGVVVITSYSIHYTKLYESLFATRGRTEDMIPVAELMDEVGFWALETWGGATFDAMHRFLNEDPWERIRTLKKYAKKTPFSMLLRAQNLVGYRNYADDVAEAFVDRAATNGMDIFRTFDALNDYRNFETVVKGIRNNFV